MQRKTATLRRWYGTWGVAHELSSSGPNTLPRKYFVHQANLQDKTAVLALGVCVSFTEGDPRTAGELPQALDIVVVGRKLYTTDELEAVKS
jgi:hypothetical protein